VIRFRFVDEHRNTHGVKRMCDVLGWGRLTMTGEQPLLQLPVLGLYLMPYLAHCSVPLTTDRRLTSKAFPRAARHSPKSIDGIQP
jgi:hypothetical protein